MNNAYIFLDSENKVSVKIGDEILSSQEAYKFIQSFNQKKIRSMVNSDENDNILIRYKKLNIYVLNSKKVFAKSGIFKPIMRNIKKYKEEETLRRTKFKKVVRENKNTIIKITALGLAGIAFISIIDDIKDKKDTKTITADTTTKNYTEYTTEVPSQSDEIKVTDKVTGKNTMLHITTESEVAETLIESDGVVELSYDNIKDDDKNTYTKLNFGNLIRKYSKIYGVDPELMIALATQENGYNINTHGPGRGLCQIEPIAVADPKRVYNYQKNEWETIKISAEDLLDLETNIKAACIIMQDSFNKKNHNILMGIQCYNFGFGNMDRVLNACAYGEDVSKTSLIEDQLSTVWLRYRGHADGGDKKYLENLFRYMGDNFKITFRTPEGETVSIGVENKAKEKVY